ncbi:hypothetical protein COV88_01765 [Candidatus Saccharibacteria bacterium CG11_big_fil_rev_8_21_14_0_20_41_19]|nr:hypothetical protein [Candidatus Saccharibacteria bacterium]OIP85733.1 MAG: hypothetical protein AUK57_02675 [Candidatus Saccharibacteria bacterium CG2_30_41_52]PIQ70849.1 MAG: hypothetical protein COV88_01765 [Candidatus Saccharibacteria bacterium CG11_big_fil_rev_8_21_14_0_20_41_19]PIZ60712.1 MAG: hypothetical protein COY18_00845 [Candidatus Saccharibacteria bacterium CG_4_10_14_0_2_um_filter_41_11]PJC29638.1 MAG: hypothetical protein CO052_02005 [Candidatus Saccharibacteria bacterium CG_4
MSLLKYLQFQEIDSSSDDIPDTHRQQDDILLDESVDEGSLEQFWEQVVQDIHDDPDWFTFADE